MEGAHPQLLSSLVRLLYYKLCSLKRASRVQYRQDPLRGFLFKNRLCGKIVLADWV